MPALNAEIREAIVNHLRNQRPDLTDQQVTEIIQRI